MQTILGAGGSIANELVKIFESEKQPYRLVSRNPKKTGDAEIISADLTNYNQTLEAIKGSSVVYLTTGLVYNIKVWKAQWPAIMRNTIEACKQHKAKLIFFDNIYCLGKVDGPMKEDTPFKPDSKKGEIRVGIATLLLDEIKAGNITAMIARAADFYGPYCKNSVLNDLVMKNMAKNKKAQCLGKDSTIHSYTYTPDCGKALWLLARSESAWNQIWHLPTAHPALTGKQMIELCAKYFGKPPRYMVISEFLCRIVGLFNPIIREVPEMMYQNNYDYVFDSSKFETAFNFTPTSYEEGVKATVSSYKP